MKKELRDLTKHSEFCFTSQEIFLQNYEPALQVQWLLLHPLQLGHSLGSVYGQHNP